MHRQIAFGMALALALNGQTSLTVAPGGPCGGSIRVTLKVTVTDQDGKAVLDLKRGDFAVTEDGKNQAIAAFAVQGPGLDYTPSATTGSPFRFLNLITLLFDFSATPRIEQTRLQDDAIDFIRNDLMPGELISIETVIAGSVEMTRNFTDDRAALVAAVNKFRAPVEGVADKIADSNPSKPDILNADGMLARIATVCGRQVFAIKESVMYFATATEAAETANRAALDAAVNACKSFDVAIYPIGTAPVSISELATKTGGQTFPASRAALDDVRSKSAGVYYFIGYYATNDRRDGGYRKVELKLTRPGLEQAKLDYSHGYFAPEPPPPPGPVCF